MKRIINTNRKPISSEEILKGKNFGELAKAYQAQVPNVPSKPFYKSGWFAGTIASVAIIATTLIVLNNNNKEITENINQNNESIDVIDSTKNKEFIDPPVPGVDVKKDRYFVNADTGGEIKHHTGTNIKIPKGAFTNKDGTPVTGEVEIKYREFHDQADIFFSGIPMDYDSAGTKYNFESAGMMEIYGYQNGKKLKITPNKEFVVCMHSKNPDPAFNLYYLDEDKKNWDCRGKDSIATEKEDTPQDFTYKPTTNNNELIDPNLFKDKKESIDQQKDVVAEIQKDIKKIEKEAPTKPLKAKKDVHSFNIDVSKTEFPEIAVYEGTIFEVIDQKNFDTKIYDTEWEDIKLAQKENGLAIELNKGKQTKKVNVKPVLEGEDYTTAIRAFNKKFAPYKKRLNERKDDEVKAKEELKTRIADMKKKQEKYYAKLSEQQKKQMEAWEAKQVASAVQRRVLKTTRTFPINSFGTWNSDRPKPPTPPKGQRVLAKYLNQETGTPISFTNMDLIEKSRNITWTLNDANRAYLQYNPKSKNYLFGVTTEGKIAIVKPNSFKEVNGKTHDFKVQLIDPKKTSIGEIKEIIKA